MLLILAEQATTLPARRLFSIVRELPSSEIYFDVDTKNFASIRSGSRPGLLGPVEITAGEAVAHVTVGELIAH